MDRRKVFPQCAYVNEHAVYPFWENPIDNRLRILLLLKSDYVKYTHLPSLPFEPHKQRNRKFLDSWHASIWPFKWFMYSQMSEKLAWQPAQSHIRLLPVFAKVRRMLSAKGCPENLSTEGRGSPKMWQETRKKPRQQSRTI